MLINMGYVYIRIMCGGKDSICVNLTIEIRLVNSAIEFISKIHLRD